MGRDTVTIHIPHTTISKKHSSLPNQKSPLPLKKRKGKSYLHTPSGQTEKCKKMTIFFWDVTVTMTMTVDSGQKPLGRISVGILKFFKTIVRPCQADVLKNGH